MDIATKTDLVNGYEGNLDAVNEGRVQYLLDTALARLRKMIPDLVGRIGESGQPGYDEDLHALARDVVVQAVLRQIRNPSPEYTQESQTAGPFSHSYSTGSGTGRGSRGLFYTEELDLLRAPVAAVAGGASTAFLPLSYWGAKGAR